MDGGVCVMTNYQTAKEKARQEAIDWQHKFSEQSYRYGELAEWGDYFTRLAKRYGLVGEFRNEGII